MKIINVVGARPNFMKIAPLLAAMRGAPAIEQLLVHTGQHYDERMAGAFFDELELPVPDISLGVGTGSHAMQTAQVMTRFEEVLRAERPDLVLVVGDVNSTLAAALTAAKMNVPVAHVEAGLRSFDRTMPEEINRIVTDAVSQYLFASEPSAVENLRREGVPEERIHFVGNVMIDTLLRYRAKADRSAILASLGLEPGGYVLLTLHRPANVDDPERLAAILSAVDDLQREIPVICPVHPRTRQRIEQFGLADRFAFLSPARRGTVAKGYTMVEPLGYFDFLKLMAEAAAVMTDSGGIQEETTVLGVPCVTVRENTERPVTITEGTNILAGTSPAGIRDALREARARGRTSARVPRLWDGRAAGRIVRVLASAPAAVPARKGVAIACSLPA